MSGKERWTSQVESKHINSRLQSNGHQNTSRYDAESDDAKYCKSTSIKPLKKNTVAEFNVPRWQEKDSVLD